MNLSKLNPVSAFLALRSFSSPVTRVSGSSQWNEDEGASIAGPEAMDTMHTASRTWSGWCVTSYFWQVGGRHRPPAEALVVATGLSREEASVLLDRKVQEHFKKGAKMDTSQTLLPFITRNRHGKEAGVAAQLATLTS